MRNSSGVVGLWSAANRNRSNVATLSAPSQQRWDRSSGAARHFDLPRINDDQLTLMAFATDAQGAPIQFLCRELSDDEIGGLDTGVLEVSLSRREG